MDVASKLLLLTKMILIYSASSEIKLKQNKI